MGARDVTSGWNEPTPEELAAYHEGYADGYAAGIALDEPDENTEGAHHAEKGRLEWQHRYGGNGRV